MKTVKRPPSKWHAVTVVLRTSSCAAATLCRNSRFLSKEAPKLPLPNCDQPDNCECRYRHFDDRRKGARRGAEIGVVSADRPARERREAKGRRTNDRR